MKKIIALLCALIMLTACCITANAATLTSIVPDEEIAKEHGYTINYGLKDGWEVPEFYLDSKNNIPNQIFFHTNKELDISQFKTDELEEFLGIEILGVYCLQDGYTESMLKWHLENYPNEYDYCITTADFYTITEAKALFAEYDFITEVQLNAYVELADDAEPVAGDVNFDGVFDSMDYLLVKRAFFGEYPEANLYCNKADLNNNLEIDAMDYLCLKRAFFNQYTIEQ